MDKREFKEAVWRELSNQPIVSNYITCLINELDESDESYEGALDRIATKFDVSALWLGVMIETLVRFAPFNLTHNELEKLLEPKKVVVPDFVGEWIETAKELYQLSCWEFTKHIFIEGENESEGYKKFRKYCEENFEIVMSAWDRGYTVEKEKKKKYRVKLPQIEGADDMYLMKLGEDFWVHDLDTDLSVEINLTEEEIKSVDERYWAFAEEVTE